MSVQRIAIIFEKLFLIKDLRFCRCVGVVGGPKTNSQATTDKSSRNTVGIWYIFDINTLRGKQFFLHRQHRQILINYF